MSDPTTGGEVVFANRHDTPLPPGEYRIEVDQALENIAPDPSRKGADAIDETYTNSRGFYVRGERFALDPGDIEGMFPPAGNSGHYDNVFAHVVFRRRTLPWGRSPELVARDGYAWLALLLFHDAERPDVRTSTVKDLLRADGGAPASVASYGDAYKLLGHDFAALEFGETVADPCLTIDVPVERFQALVPTLAELCWLAHARKVSLAKKAGGIPDATGDYSVVVGNRLPRSGATCTAHVVSLEGMKGFLRPDDAHGDPAVSTPAGAATTVRLVSLASWTFTSVDPHETFAGYLEQASFDPPNLQRPPPKDPGRPGDPVVTAFDLGYTAMNHRTRTGNDTVSWYRGPLTPYETTAIVPAPHGGTPIETADQAALYDPASGMFDVSYAAAWEVGRLLAVGNASYSSALYAFKRAAARATLAAVTADELRAAHTAAAWIAANVTPRLERDPEAATALRAAPPPRRPRADRADVLRRAATDADGMRALHTGIAVPEAVAGFLTSLVRLEGVPFTHLVPDAEMLPTESLRFFDLDLSWVTALLEGAFSIGRSSSADTTLDAALAPALYAAARMPARASGFLLRSAVVDGWPNLEVTPYAPGGAELPPPPLRMERIAPSVLFYIYPAALGSVAVHEPAEGLHFGLDEANHPPPAVKPLKELRWLVADPDGPPAGTLDSSITAPVSFRADPFTLRVAQFAADAESNLKAKKAAAPAFTSAELAIELVATVDRVEFKRQEIKT